MKRILSIAALCVGISLAPPAFARHGDWIPSENVTMSTAMLPSGDIKMKVTMPQAQWKAMGKDMRNVNGSCRVESISPGDMTTMILVCSPPPA
jgi:hypothetical protein